MFYNCVEHLFCELGCRSAVNGTMYERRGVFPLEPLNEIMFKKNITHALSAINSYLGFLKHYHTLRLRLKVWEKIKKHDSFLCLDRSAFKVFIR